MKKQGRILVVDDNEEILIALRLLLQDYFSEISCEKNPNLIPARLEQSSYDVYILDMNFKSGRYTGNEGIFWMNRILAKDPQAVIIFITAYGDIDLAVKAIKEGATDFIQKPWLDEKLISTVLSAYKLRSSRAEVHELKTKQEHLHRHYNKPGNKIIGTSDAINKILKQVSKVAGTDANVLITGENGTGKELVARAIHQHSGRASEVFVSVDMGAISSSLFESELFGHKKGSFTDAHEDRPGRFEIANHGTLFLDEIGNLPYTLQPKLLSVLQNRKVVRLGTNNPVPIDIRLITATNMPLERMVRQGSFREDLLYRLNTITIHIPPLRERIDDIPQLFTYFLEKFKAKYNKDRIKTDVSVISALQSYSWPGNIRELEHATEKAVIMNESGVITSADFSLGSSNMNNEKGEKETLNLEKNEIYIIRKAIESTRGNLSQASRILGITRKTLYNKINKYGI